MKARFMSANDLFEEMKRKVFETVSREGYEIPKDFLMSYNQDKTIRTFCPYMTSKVFKVDLDEKNLPMFIEEISRQVFICIKRKINEENGTEKQNSLMHPLAILLALHCGFKRGESLPFRKNSGKDEYPFYPYQLLFEQTSYFDVICNVIATWISGSNKPLPIRLEASPYWQRSSTTLSLYTDGPFPDSIITSLKSKKLKEFIELPRVGDQNINSAVDALEIREIEVSRTDSFSPNGICNKISFERCEWKPWRKLPDDMKRLYELSSEEM
jgi:hypothetical protein